MREVKNDSTLDQNVIKTLLYYDIFNYPLNANEIFRFLGINSVTENDVVLSLNGLVNQQHLFRFGEFYSIQPHEANIIRRIKGNSEAEKYVPLAKQKASFIARFPFVRAVMASGSLSKGYMDEKSDLDFFIITQPGRLWIARMLLVMYKRIFLFNSHRHFCVNYFVDYDHLEIEEKNIFTATELATVLPLYGRRYYDRLQTANPWVGKFFPNYTPRPTDEVLDDNSGWLKKVTEKLVNFLGGNACENFFMALTLKRWKNIYQKGYAKADFDVAFKTKKHASKNHPRHFQKTVTELYEQKINEFSKRFDLTPHD